MKYFRCCRTGIDVGSFIDELAIFEGGWSDKRAKAIPLHRETLAIALRSAVLNPGEDIKECELDTQTENYKKFPKLTNFLEKFAEDINGLLSRINIVSLKSGGKVYPHIDGGTYYKNRDRYHLILQSTKGSLMRSGDEECIWHEGEVLWFDNKAMHEAYNESNETERIHVIFDIKPKL